MSLRPLARAGRPARLATASPARPKARATTVAAPCQLARMARRRQSRTRPRLAEYGSREGSSPVFGAVGYLARSVSGRRVRSVRGDRIANVRPDHRTDRPTDPFQCAQCPTRCAGRDTYSQVDTLRLCAPIRLPLPPPPSGSNRTMHVCIVY